MITFRSNTESFVIWFILVAAHVGHSPLCLRCINKYDVPDQPAYQADSFVTNAVLRMKDGKHRKVSGFPRSHSSQMAEPGFEPRWGGS